MGKSSGHGNTPSGRKAIIEVIAALIAIGGIFTYLESRFGKIEGILTETSNRVERIAQSLPDQITIASNDYWKNHVNVIYTAYNDSTKINGKEFKVAKFIDTKDGSSVKFAVPVAQFSKSQDAIFQLTQTDQHARNLYQIKLDAQAYQPTQSFTLPDNVNPQDSYALSYKFDDVINNYKKSASVIKVDSQPGTAEVKNLQDVEQKLKE